MRRKLLQIAIDGPIGSGKSTVAAEVARRLGVAPSTVWKWENGRAEPGVRVLPGVYEFLGYRP